MQMSTILGWTFTSKGTTWVMRSHKGFELRLRQGGLQSPDFRPSKILDGTRFPRGANGEWLDVVELLIALLTLTIFLQSFTSLLANLVIGTQEFF
jgi:hypothetical protein